MRMQCKCYLWLGLLLVVLVLAASFVLPRVLAPVREGGPHTSEFRRYQNISRVLSAIRRYARQHNDTYPYSSEGSDAALRLVLAAEGNPRNVESLRTALTWLDHEATQDSGDLVTYAYLNPEAGAQLTGDTVILVERDFYYGDRSVYAATGSWEIALLRDVQCVPEGLLGAHLPDLVVVEEER